MIANRTVVCVLMNILSTKALDLILAWDALITEKRGSHASYHNIDTDTDRDEETRLQYPMWN